MKPKIGIVSFENDIHALIIEKLLIEEWEVECHLMEFDRVAGGNNISWRLHEDIVEASAVSRSGEVSVGSLDLIWWRRTSNVQKHSNCFVEDEVKDLINKDSKDAFLGSLLTAFNGKWISHPFATQNASNKILQLSAATKCGFRTPKTLITQSSKRLKEFYEEVNRDAIVKPLTGTNKQVLYTRNLVEEDFYSNDSIECSPLIYQQCINGEDHFRVNVFGSSIYAFQIKSQDLDWRGNLKKKIEPVELPCEIENQIIATLRHLNLEMGVVDIKRCSEGEYYWFEVNPQGQFLFIEGITGFNLKDVFCKYLINSALEFEKST